jgi:hypothetical protein
VNRPADALPFADTDAVGPFVVNESRQRLRNASFALVPPLLAVLCAGMLLTLRVMDAHQLLPQGPAASNIGRIEFTSAYLVMLIFTVVMVPMDAFQFMRRDRTAILAVRKLREVAA